MEPAKPPPPPAFRDFVLHHVTEEDSPDRTSKWDEDAAGLYGAYCMWTKADESGFCMEPPWSQQQGSPGKP